MNQFTRPAPSLDGVWQMTSDCGGSEAASLLLDLAETAPNTFTSERIEPCGLQGIFGTMVVPINNCNPSPKSCTLGSCSNVGDVDGAGIVTFPSNSADYAPGYVDFDPITLTDPVNPCTVLGEWTLASETTQARVDGTVRHVAGSDADLITGTLTPGNFEFFDAVGPPATACFSIPDTVFSPCPVELRRAQAAASPTVAQTVEPLEDVLLTFEAASLSMPATVLVSEVTSPEVVIPPEFSIAGALLFDIELDPPGALVGTVEVCLPYPDSDSDGFVDGTVPPLDETTLELLHAEGGAWVPLATTVDATADQVCADTTSFSQFVAVPEPGQGSSVLVGFAFLQWLRSRSRRGVAAARPIGHL